MSATITLEAVVDAVYQAIDQLNETLPPDSHVPKSPETKLAGADGHLDSLGLVNLIVETEQVIEERFDVLINLGDEQAASQQQNPLTNILTLAQYIQTRLS